VKHTAVTGSARHGGAPLPREPGDRTAGRDPHQPKRDKLTASEHPAAAGDATSRLAPSLSHEPLELIKSGMNHTRYTTIIAELVGPLPPGLARLAVGAALGADLVSAAVARLPSLTPSHPSAGSTSSVAAIRAGVVEQLHGRRGGVAGTALTAGLLQMNDWLDASHQQSQSIECEGSYRSGDYWHAIMHRREPDYGNAKYWFHSLGRHPVFTALSMHAAAILSDCPADAAGDWKRRLSAGSEWDAFGFVDLCQSVARVQDSPLGVAARQIQWVEMLLLLGHCCREAEVEA
jgi:hypothetical protein